MSYEVMKCENNARLTYPTSAVLLQYTYVQVRVGRSLYRVQVPVPVYTGIDTSTTVLYEYCTSTGTSRHYRRATYRRLLSRVHCRSASIAIPVRVQVPCKYRRLRVHTGTSAVRVRVRVADNHESLAIRGTKSFYFFGTRLVT